MEPKEMARIRTVKYRMNHTYPRGDIDVNGHAKSIGDAGEQGNTESMKQ